MARNMKPHRNPSGPWRCMTCGYQVDCAAAVGDGKFLCMECLAWAETREVAVKVAEKAGRAICVRCGEDMGVLWPDESEALLLDLGGGRILCPDCRSILKSEQPATRKAELHMLDTVMMETASSGR